MGVVRRGTRYRWPGGEIRYTIDPALPKKDRVHEAIRQWEEHTHIRFVKRRRHDQNFAIFIEENDPDAHCNSPVGMIGGPQHIRLAKGCSTGSVSHEIGHAVGLYHEHQRQDRASFVKVLLDNVKDGRESNFKPKGMDVGYYDYDSIMHYPEKAFSIKDEHGNRLTTVKPKYPQDPIIPNPPRIGQRNHLSRGDINTVYFIYYASQAFQPSRLLVGDKAQLDLRTTPNNVRYRPGLAGRRRRQQIRPGQRMKILDGPEYADNYIWWFVHVHSGNAGFEGWTAEAGEDGYWLVPLFDS